MCNCAKAAISQGYIIQGGTYDEVKHDFVDTGVFCMPFAIGKRTIRLGIKYCPICGNKLGK